MVDMKTYYTFNLVIYSRTQPSNLYSYNSKMNDIVNKLVALNSQINWIMAMDKLAYQFQTDGTFDNRAQVDQLRTSCNFRTENYIIQTLDFRKLKYSPCIRQRQTNWYC